MTGLIDSQPEVVEIDARIAAVVDEAARIREWLNGQSEIYRAALAEWESERDEAMAAGEQFRHPRPEPVDDGGRIGQLTIQINALEQERHRVVAGVCGRVTDAARSRYDELMAQVGEHVTALRALGSEVAVLQQSVSEVSSAREVIRSADPSLGRRTLPVMPHPTPDVLVSAAMSGSDLLGGVPVRDLGMTTNLSALLAEAPAREVGMQSNVRQIAPDTAEPPRKMAHRSVRDLL